MATSPAATPSSDEQNLTGLLALPAELRNRIYDLVFAIDTTGQVELLDAEPPSKELILTCQQICGETRLLYQAAYQTFWRETTFTITLDFGGHHMFINRALRGLRTEDVENIRSLRITTSMSTFRKSYSLEDGVWIGMNAGRSDRLLATEDFKRDLLWAGYRDFGTIGDWGDAGRSTLFSAADAAPAKKILQGRSITREEIMVLTKNVDGRSWPPTGGLSNMRMAPGSDPYR